MKDDHLYLIHISECIERIEEYVASGQEKFIKTTMIQDAVLRNLHTLTESTQRLSNNLKDKYPNIPWANISGFRNVVVHNYLGIDLSRIWDIVNDDIPNLKHQIQNIRQDLGI